MNSRTESCSGPLDARRFISAQSPAGSIGRNKYSMQTPTLQPFDNREHQVACRPVPQRQVSKPFKNAAGWPCLTLLRSDSGSQYVTSRRRQVVRINAKYSREYQFHDGDPGGGLAVIQIRNAIASSENVAGRPRCARASRIAQRLLALVGKSTNRRSRQM
jgi:hypothetical protein